MGVLNENADAADRVADIMKALGHPVRLRIVSLLCDGERNVNGLAEELGHAQSVVSQQLRILRMSGLVHAERENGFSNYRIAEPRLKDLLKCLEGCPRAK